MKSIYQNNNVINNNQQVYQKSMEQEHEVIVPFRKKVKVKLDDNEISTILIGQTDRSYVTYDGHILSKDKVISINEL